MLKMNPAKFFVYCALLFGILLITLIPPFQSPDEDSHFKRAYVLSKGNLFPTSQNGLVGYELPTDMVRYINEKLTFIGNRDKKYSYSEEILDDKLPKDYSDVSFQNFSTVESTPVAYIAPAVGIVFSKVTTKLIGMDNISVATMLHFARFFSLLLYVFLVHLAIKITPILKKTFCIIGLLPMSLALAVAISYDSVLIALSLLSTAMILKLIFDDNVKKVSYKYLIAFGVIAYIMLSVKTIYITVLIPLIFVPKEKFGKNIPKVLKSFGIIIGIALAIYFVMKIPSMNLQRNAVQDNSGEQIKYILSNPIEFTKTCINSMWGNRNFYINGMIGMFGLLDTYIPTIYIVIYAIAAFAIVLSDFSLCPVKFDWKYKCVSLIGSIGTVFAVFAGLYILWTSMELGVGATTITGVQGRYFIPIIPLGMMVLSNSVLKKNKTIKSMMGKVLNSCYIVPFGMLSITTITILLRYWC
ncbi:MAG: DUF2142 domain-containing protein [Clostridia bacterium]|nr:DUF2142 domain-containing protein [Clostridia bacterium]